MIRKVTIVFICTVLAQLGYSCTSCFGVKDEPPYYNVKGYNSLSYRTTGVNQYYSYTLEKLTDHQQVAYDALVIAIEAVVDYHAASAPASLFGNNAFACDPEPPGYRGTKETLDSLLITSLYDFDNTHPKGSKLNDLFDVYDGNTTRQQSLNDYLNQEKLQAPENIRLMLNSTPTASEAQRFLITFYLSGGEKYTVETIPLRIE